MNKPKWLDVIVDDAVVEVVVNNDRNDETWRDKTRIRKSIQKFQYLLTLTARYPTHKISWSGTQTCPLCWKYNDSWTPQSERCVGCPIRERTKKRFCGGTPYDEIIKTNKANELQSLIGLEIEFLESLL